MLANGLEPFTHGRRDEECASGVEPGAGLGLAIALAVAEAHGGSLTLENPVEGGALVTITIKTVDVPSAGRQGVRSIA
jgi:signal transduction histidine kinase